MTTADDDEKPVIMDVGLGFGAAGVPEQDEPAPELRLLVIGQFSPGRDWAATVPRPGATRLRDRGADDLLADGRVTLEIAVEDPADPASRLTVPLAPRSLRDFRPGSLLEQVPILSRASEARSLLRQGGSRERAAALLPASFARLALGAAPEPEPASPAASDGGSAIDSLLSMVDLPAEAAAPRGLSAVIADVARGPSGVRIDGDAVEKLDELLRRLLASVLAHPEVRRLEETHRGLSLLASSFAGKRGVFVDVIDTTFDGVDAALEAVAAAQSEPLDAILVAHAIDPTASHLDALTGWARHAAALRAPLVAGVAVQVLGVRDVDALARSETRLRDAETPEAKLFRVFASRDAAQWVALAVNRPLGRAAYTQATSRSGELRFAEPDAANVFVSAAWALGARLVESHLRTGWPCAVAGLPNGRVENLPVFERDSIARPVEVVLSMEVTGECAKAGVTALTCAPNGDAALVPFARVAYRGNIGPSGTSKAASIDLCDQLFVCRLEKLLAEVAAALPSGTPASTTRDVVLLTLMGSFGDVPRRPDVKARVEPGFVEVTVRPSGFLGVEIDELTVRAALP